jgi:hypothetical protein
VAFTDGFVSLASPLRDKVSEVPAPVFVITTAEEANTDLLKIWGMWRSRGRREDKWQEVGGSVGRRAEGGQKEGGRRAEIQRRAGGWRKEAGRRREGGWRGITFD